MSKSLKLEGITFGQTWSMILSITKQVTYKKERKVSKKMFSTEDDETKTNERIKDRYRNCILIQYLGRKA